MGRMHTGPGDPANRAGVLVLRVWLEGRDQPELRIRMIGNLNLDVDDHDAAAAAQRINGGGAGGRVCFRRGVVGLQERRALDGSRGQTGVRRLKLSNE